MKTDHGDGIRYQVIPYSISVIKGLLQMDHGVKQLYKFMKDSRLIENGAEMLAEKKRKLDIS